MHLRTRGLTLRTTTSGVMPPARLMLVESSRAPIIKPPRLEGCRVAILDPDPGNADALAQALRERGAEVVVLSVNPESLERAEALDPDVVLVEPRDFAGSCWEIVRAIWQHPRLRFATVMLASPEPIGPGGSTALDVHGVSEAIRAANAECERIRDAALTGKPQLFTLESLGPVRTLRALLSARCSLRVEFACPELTIEVDLSDELVVGAQGGPGAIVSGAYLGPHALAVLLWQDEGNVRVRPVERPAVTNIMAPLGAALHGALAVQAEVRASGVRWAPVSTPPGERPSLSPRGVARVDRVVTKSLAPAPAPLDPREIPEPDVLARNERQVVAVAAPPGKARKERAAPAPSQPRIVRTLAGIAPPPLVAQIRKQIAEGASLPSAAADEPAPALAPALTPAPELKSASSAVAAPLAHEPPPPLSSLVQVPAAALRSLRNQAPRAPEPLPEPAPPPVAAHEELQPSPQRALDSLVQPLDANRARLRWAGALGGCVMVALTMFMWMRSAGPGPEVASAAAPPALAPLVREPARPQQQAPAAVQADSTAPEEPDSDDMSPRARSKRASKLVSQGHSFRKRGLLETARNRYQQALDQFPDYPRAYVGLAQVAIKQSKGEEAEGYVHKLLSAKPDDREYLTLLGDAYDAQGLKAEARETWQRAARHGSRSAKKRLEQ